jgi:hypothetical protein
MLGLEYRPTFWINIYNRLRHLDFSDLPEFKEARSQGITRNLSLREKDLEEPRRVISRVKSDLMENLMGDSDEEASDSSEPLRLKNIE